MNDNLETPDRDSSFQSSELPLLLLFIPVGLFFGWHIAWLAMLIRRLTGVPYLVSMIVNQ